MIELFFDYTSRNQMRTSDLITHRFPPESAQEAYALLTEKRSDAMGVIFDW
jgi:threonine dehydrogenase-like Zn-dependent dehydrogenase